MKKIALILVAMLVMTFVGAFAAADVIIPPDNDFYEEHADECEYLDRNYLTMGELNLLISPESEIKQTACPNFEQLHVQYTYTDDNNVVWGLAVDGYQESLGWFRLTDAVLKYDNISFMEEYDSRISEYTESTPTFDNDEVLFYTYPNSGEYNQGRSTSDAVYEYVFVDDAGLAWIYTPYFQLQEGWVCVEDPMNAQLNSAMLVYTAQEDPTPDTEPDPTEEPTTAPTGCSSECGNCSAYIWVACIVGVVVIATVVLLVIFFGKKKANKE